MTIFFIPSFSLLPRFANKILKRGSTATTAARQQQSVYMSPSELAVAVETRAASSLRCHPLLHLCLALGRCVSRNQASDLAGRLTHANLAWKLCNAEPTAPFFLLEVRISILSLCVPWDLINGTYMCHRGAAAHTAARLPEPGRWGLGPRLQVQVIMNAIVNTASLSVITF